MNDALHELLQFTRANFWDWQFYVFAVVAALIIGSLVLQQQKLFDQRSWLESISQYARNDSRNYVYVVLASALSCFLIVLIAGIPIPQTHDEFGHLLAADTFLNGRIANPTPFSPSHFEYFHILLTPVYAAKFPPLQGMFLAAGTFLTGLPVAGIWLSSIASNVAVYWLLRYFFSPGWSLYGSFLWIAAPLNIKWCDSYWGAHAAVIGGALSAGAFFRFITHGKLTNLLLWGAGIFLLFNSRLYEGAILTGLLLSWWIVDLSKTKNAGRRHLQSVAVFLVLILANIGWLSFYNYSITQDPMRLPYSLHHSQYHQVPLFIFQSPDDPKAAVPPIIKKLDEAWVTKFQRDHKDPASTLLSVGERIPAYFLWLTNSPFLLILFLIGLWGFVSDRAEYFGTQNVVLLACYLAALLLTTFMGDRFLGPIVGIAFVSMTVGARLLFRATQFARPLLLTLPFVVGGAFLLGTYAQEQKKIPLQQIEDNLQSRQQIIDRLTAQGGDHLVFVDAGEANLADTRFYVYNNADIEAARIIWAHDLNPSANRDLIDHHEGRRIWLLKHIDNRAILEDYDLEYRR